MSGSEVDAEACLLAAIEWAREGGRMIKEAWDRSLSGAESDAVAVEFKGTIDLVTEVDKAVETLITRKIGERFPQHAILGEEAAAEQGHYTLGDEPTWCIDPIDGTTNFVHHFPFSCVSIGLCVNKRSLLGVVYVKPSKKKHFPQSHAHIYVAVTIQFWKSCLQHVKDTARF
ncbi:MAG: inositol monophosphatase family protein [archaeon]|nr:inositol monophosphatase family protein [archaeon]